MCVTYCLHGKCLILTSGPGIVPEDVSARVIDEKILSFLFEVYLHALSLVDRHNTLVEIF